MSVLAWDPRAFRAWLESRPDATICGWPRKASCCPLARWRQAVEGNDWLMVTVRSVIDQGPPGDPNVPVGRYVGELPDWAQRLARLVDQERAPCGVTVVRVRALLNEVARAIRDEARGNNG